jgi:hypothetical protein
MLSPDPLGVGARRSVAVTASHHLRRLRKGRADRATAASPTNAHPHQAHRSVLELTYPRAQRFGKQEEAHARERLAPDSARGARAQGESRAD